jgi:SAM-dependent methyltransferase
LGKAELDALYHQGNAESWQAGPASRPDWGIASEWVLRYLPSGSTMLDVGCFDGEFLRSVGSDYRRSGIEIHEAARKKAQESGIDLIATDFSALPETKAIFDAVASFDVVEHTLNPLDFLGDLARVTREDGIVIVSTGNSDAVSWRLLGARYWYCAIGEHMSFINPRWCKWAAPRVGLELKEVITFSHVSASRRQRIGEVVKNLFYAVFPRGFALLRAIGLGDAEFRKHKELLQYPPSWVSSSDHFICLFIKKKCTATD